MSFRREDQFVPGEEERFRPDDGCPLFSERLEDHLVAFTRGELPNRGRFCGHCYTPLAGDSKRCPHCGEETSARPPTDRVPDAIVEVLRRQRSTEARWVNGFAYLGLLIAVVGGISLVLVIPFFKDNLIWATIFYGLILLIGGRSLAGVLGGYYGDRIGYERARTATRAAWDDWLATRDEPSNVREERSS